ncbi:MAG: transposase family protein [Gammaproteobacteria bacterium]|nr:transposase family protein [Gammaproteobacteria bacterium]
MSNEFKQFLRQRNILHIRSPVYHPMANGLVEVFNRFLKRGIECLSAQAGSVESGINDLLIQFRSTAPEFGKSPAELMFGWKIRPIWDNWNPFLLEGDEHEGVVSEIAKIYSEGRPDTLSMEERRQVVAEKFRRRRCGLEKWSPRPFSSR